MHVRLKFDIQRQPDDVTCGPTCLQAVYAYYEDEISLADVIAAVPQLESGGTLAVLLGCHALRRGYRATLYTYNLHIFDPTWFRRGTDLADRLRSQAGEKRDPRVRTATAAYLEFLELGGRVLQPPLRTSLIREPLRAGKPVLVGLNATFLYGCAREREGADGRMIYDDVGGEPVGHFVVLSGYDRRRKRVWVADPLFDNPLSKTHFYAVPTRSVVDAMLLGMSTYDANFLVLEAPTEGGL